MIRFLISAPIALFFTLLLFYSLALITSTGERADSINDLNPVIDFFMVRQENEIEVRQRKLPEPQEMVQQQPPIPKTQTSVDINVDISLLSIDVPDISMEMDINLSPTLHNLSMPATLLSIDSNPVVMERFPPRYPQRALMRKQQGKVVVEFIITEQGTVREDSVVVVESSPPGVFDKAVLRAIKRWRFQKRIENGQAIAFKAKQALEFKLEK